MSRTRRTPFGRRRRPPPSTQTYVGLKPQGWTDLPDVDAPLGSMLSGQNVWFAHGRLGPRSRLTTLGGTTSATSAAPMAWIHDDIDGVQYPMAGSGATVSYFELTGTWSTLTYTASGSSNYPPSGAELDAMFGDSVYLPRRDLNITVFTNGVDPLFAWGGPSDGTQYSTLTQAPIASDVVTFDNSPVVWNTLEFDQNKRFVTRVQWPQVQNPENWTGIGAGFEDLVDMRGFGTRAFVMGDEIYLFTNQEIYRGRRVGGAFRFAFTPLSRELGLPFKRAAIRTKLGIFWLNDDYMVYLLSPGGQIQPVGQPILQELRDTAVDLHRAFFSVNEPRQDVTLHYTTTANAWPNRAFTWHVVENQWTPQRFTHTLTTATHADLGLGAVVWNGSDWVNGANGTVVSQTSTWEQLTGQDGIPDTMLFSSTGSSFGWSSTESLDAASVVQSQWVSGGLFSGDPIHRKWVDLVRVDARAESASSLSVGVSGNLGGGYVNATERAFSVGSNTSQLYIPLTVGGEYFALKFESDETGWEVSRAFLRGRILGDMV